MDTFDSSRWRSFMAGPIPIGAVGLAPIAWRAAFSSRARFCGFEEGRSRDGAAHATSQEIRHGRRPWALASLGLAPSARWALAVSAPGQTLNGPADSVRADSHRSAEAIPPGMGYT